MLGVMARFNKHKHQKAQKTLTVKKQRKPKFIDRLVYVAAIVEPLCSLPQAYAVWSTRSAGSVSILSWLGFVVMGAIWVWYAIVNREKIVLIYQGMFFIVDSVVLVGAIVFGGKL
jgi:uncharacterized protein with PQ loop repeat